ncbi:hypothetical protein VTK26DRAFT_2155 [Humicola hyalothermophila]
MSGVRFVILAIALFLGGFSPEPYLDNSGGLKHILRALTPWVFAYVLLSLSCLFLGREDENEDNEIFSCRSNTGVAFSPKRLPCWGWFEPFNRTLGTAESGVLLSDLFGTGAGRGAGVQGLGWLWPLSAHTSPEPHRSAGVSIVSVELTMHGCAVLPAVRGLPVHCTTPRPCCLAAAWPRQSWKLATVGFSTAEDREATVGCVRVWSGAPRLASAFIVCSAFLLGLGYASHPSWRGHRSFGRCPGAV